jgi:hypothetical protein
VKFHAPAGGEGDRHAPANTPGLRHLAFAVDDIDAVVAGLDLMQCRPGRYCHVATGGEADGSIRGDFAG